MAQLKSTLITGTLDVTSAISQKGIALSNTYLGKTDTATNSAKLNNKEPSYYLEWGNITNKPTNLVTTNSNGKIPESYLPSYVDDVLEYNSKSAFPGATEAETGKIYIDTSTNLTYRWGGSQYVLISSSLALGETSSTAYAGDKGKANATNIAALQTTINNALPLNAGNNVKFTSENGGITISAEGSVKKVNNQEPDNNGNVSITLADLGAATVATSGSYNDLSDKPTLPTLHLAASDTLGGIKIGYSSTSNNLAVQLDNEKAYISLPDHLKEFYKTVVNKPVSSGFYAFQDTNNSSAKVAFGNKATAYTWVSANNSGWAGQIGISFHSDDIAFRRKENTTDNWKSWIGIATKPWVDQNYSLKGHTHSASEVSGLITTRDIFCIDLVTDWAANMMPLDGGQINLGEDILTMIYGNFIDDNNYEEFGIMLGLNNGTTEFWFALVNNVTDEVAYQSDSAIYDDTDTAWFEDLNNLSNYHIEVFSCTYEEASNAFGKSDKGYSDYYDITLARGNLTYLCTIRLNEDKTAWIVEQ